MRKLLIGATAMILLATTANAIHYIKDDDSEDQEVKSWYYRVVRSDTTPDTSACRNVPVNEKACQADKPQGKHDNGPGSSCCGEADAYWADEYVIHDGEFYAIVTDERTVPGRPFVPVGTKIKVPQKTLDVFHQGNPTGHAIVFLASGEYPICYFFGTGG